MSNYPNINKIFDDLDSFRDFCRFENRGYPFNEAALYNKKDPVWIAYTKHQTYLKAKSQNKKKFRGERSE
jgi:hypothetical protein